MRIKKVDRLFWFWFWMLTILFGGFAVAANAFAGQPGWTDPSLPKGVTVTFKPSVTSLSSSNSVASSSARSGSAANSVGIAGGSFGGSASANAPTSVFGGGNNTSITQKGGWAAPGIAFGEGSGGGADCPTEGFSILGLGAGAASGGGGLFSRHHISMRCDHRMYAYELARLSGCPNAGIAYLIQTEPDVAQLYNGVHVDPVCAPPPPVVVPAPVPIHHHHHHVDPCPRDTHEVKLCVPDSLPFRPLETGH